MTRMASGAIVLQFLSQAWNIKLGRYFYSLPGVCRCGVFLAKVLPTVRGRIFHLLCVTVHPWCRFGAGVGRPDCLLWVAQAGLNLGGPLVKVREAAWLPLKASGLIFNF